MHLFANHDDALMFALRFTSQQYPQSELAKLMKTPGIGGGKGMIGLDGAAQAGVIKSRIDALGELQRACIIARYSARVETCSCCGSDKMLEEYRAAILNLANWASQFIGNDNSVQRIRFAIVQEYFERGNSLGKQAEKINVPKRTAYDQKKKIWPHLADLDKMARTHIGDQLGDLCGED